MEFKDPESEEEKRAPVLCTPYPSLVGIQPLGSQLGAQDEHSKRD